MHFLDPSDAADPEIVVSESDLDRDVFLSEHPGGEDISAASREPVGTRPFPVAFDLKTCGVEQLCDCASEVSRRQRELNHGRRLPPPGPLHPRGSDAGPSHLPTLAKIRPLKQLFRGRDH